jgi:hypothetical protein
VPITSNGVPWLTSDVVQRIVGVDVGGGGGGGGGAVLPVMIEFVSVRFPEVMSSRRLPPLAPAGPLTIVVFANVIVSPWFARAIASRRLRRPAASAPPGSTATTNVASPLPTACVFLAALWRSATKPT